MCPMCPGARSALRSEIGAEANGDVVEPLLFIGQSRECGRQRRSGVAPAQVHHRMSMLLREMTVPSGCAASPCSSRVSASTPASVRGRRFPQLFFAAVQRGDDCCGVVHRADVVQDVTGRWCGGGSRVRCGDDGRSLTMTWL
jgi:hypothetical protein